MSPEQARGRQVDRRADIWAFGVVLCEMLSGNPVFQGDGVSEVLAAVIRDEPDFSGLPPETPEMARLLISRCLKKDPKQRQRDIGDVRLQLEELSSGREQGRASTVPPTAAPQKRGLPWALAIAASLLATVFAWNSLKEVATTPHTVARLEINVPMIEQQGRQLGSPPIAISQDGKTVAFVSHGEDSDYQLYLRRLGQFQHVPLNGTEGAQSPFFSPDGRWIGFLTGTEIRKVSVDGQKVQTLYRSSTRLPTLGATWLNDGRIVIGIENLGLMTLPDSGGQLEPLTSVKPRQGLQHGTPHPLPGSDHILFSVTASGISLSRSQVALLNLRTGDWKLLFKEEDFGSQPHYLSDGYLVFADGDQLMATSFDASKGTVTRDPVAAMSGIGFDMSGGLASFDVSLNGVLVFLGETEDQLVWVDREGRESKAVGESGDFRHPRLSRDGRRVVVLQREAGRRDLWVVDLERQTQERITFGEHTPAPLWGPDPDYLTFSATGPGILTVQAGGTGSPKPLLESDVETWPMSWTMDGQTLAFERRTNPNGLDIWITERENPQEARALISTEFNEESPRFSPDARYLAYVSDHSGRYEVYVTPYPGLQSRWQVSVGGGTEPVWGPDGTELFYRTREALFAVAVRSLGSGLDIGGPELLVEGRYDYSDVGHAHYDVSPDGRRFIMVKENSRSLRELKVVLNWAEELK